MKSNSKKQLYKSQHMQRRVGSSTDDKLHMSLKMLTKHKDALTINKKIVFIESLQFFWLFTAKIRPRLMCLTFPPLKGVIINPESTYRKATSNSKPVNTGNSKPVNIKKSYKKNIIFKKKKVGV